MSKLSFRARALDASKPLPIYHAQDVPDLSDYQAINRTVPQMPTGMEKEEETERHLQEVILAQQTNCHHEVFIPTPEVAVDVAHYERVYQKVLYRQSPYIRVPGLGLEEELPDYDLDSEDEEWLNAQTKERPLSPLHFERMMDKLERGSGNTVLSVRDAQGLLKDEEDLVIAVYDYWLAKRLRLGRALIPAVKHERRDGTSSNNPYLAFRKRTEKMQTRKNRKNDETAYMQMLKLKRDLAKAKNLAEYILERESKKNLLAKIEADIFKRRYQLEDWSGSVMSSLRPVSTRFDTSGQLASSVGDGWDNKSTLNKVESEDHVQMIGRQPVLLSSGLKRKSKKKKFYFPPGTPEPEPVIPATPENPVKDISQITTAEKSDDEEPDGIFTFRRKPHVRYHKVLDYSDDSSWDLGTGVPLGGPSSRKRLRYSCTGFGGSYIGTARRRVGRGGRVMWDRAHGSEGEGEGEEEEEEPLAAVAENQNEITDPRLKRCRYISRSPSPTSNFEFQSFPFIDNPDPSVPPADPVTTMAIFEFGGFASDSELPEDASSFSTLPTSLFALKPSSSDVECENSSQDENKLGPAVASAVSMLDRSNGHQTDLHDPRTGLGSRSAPFVDRTRGDVIASPSLVAGRPSDLPLSQPAKTLSLKPPPAEHIRRHQHPPSQNSVVQNLSGTLTTKTPVLVPPPSSTTHTTSLTASSLPNLAPAPPLETSRVASTTPAVHTAATSLLSSIAKTSGSLKSSMPLLGDATDVMGHNQTKPVDTCDKSNSLEQKEAASTRSVSPVQTLAATNNVSGTGGDGSTSTQPSSNSKSDRKPSVTQGCLTNAQPLPKSESTTSDSSTPLPCSQISWLMDGPASNILLLNSRRAPNSPSSRKTHNSGFITNAASAITAQFLQNPGKEESSSVPVRGSEPLSAARAISLGLNRELHLPMAQSTIPMTSSRLPTSLPPTPITPKLEGHPQVFEKRTVSAQNLVARRASTTTNGSSYPEIFHTTARRFSDTTERGLKQALTGINHNSLIDSATNSLVQPRANPSEVT